MRSAESKDQRPHLRCQDSIGANESQLFHVENSTSRGFGLSGELSTKGLGRIGRLVEPALPQLS